ncbi:hypothetical protein MACH15_23800 [Maricaulis maris]|nr:hypothetical protein MACH15_23800 [Maricaulis maris]
MGDRATKGGQAQLQEGQEDLSDRGDRRAALMTWRRIIHAAILLLEPDMDLAALELPFNPAWSGSDKPGPGPGRTHEKAPNHVARGFLV